MATALVIGSTGLVGHEILKILLSHPAFQTIHTISRRAPPEHPKLRATVSADTSTWAATVGSLSPKPDVVISALGTTLLAAGSLAAQKAIDQDLNLALAKAAREAGVGTFVFLSSGGTRGPFSAAWPYAKMKVAVEDGIKELGFETAGVVVRPGYIMGRARYDDPAAQKRGKSMTERLLNGGIAALGKVAGSKAVDFIAQDHVVIARACVRAAADAIAGNAPAKFWSIEGPDVVRLGRDEWQG